MGVVALNPITQQLVQAGQGQNAPIAGVAPDTQLPSSVAAAQLMAPNTGSPMDAAGKYIVGAKMQVAEQAAQAKAENEKQTKLAASAAWYKNAIKNKDSAQAKYLTGRYGASAENLFRAGVLNVKEANNDLSRWSIQRAKDSKALKQNAATFKILNGTIGAKAFNLDSIDLKNISPAAAASMFNQITEYNKSLVKDKVIVKDGNKYYRVNGRGKMFEVPMPKSSQNKNIRDIQDVLTGSPKRTIDVASNTNVALNDSYPANDLFNNFNNPEVQDILKSGIETYAAMHNIDVNKFGALVHSQIQNDVQSLYGSNENVIPNVLIKQAFDKIVKVESNPTLTGAESRTVSVNNGDAILTDTGARIPIASPTGLNMVINYLHKNPDPYGTPFEVRMNRFNTDPAFQAEIAKAVSNENLHPSGIIPSTVKAVSDTIDATSAWLGGKTNDNVIPKVYNDAVGNTNPQTKKFSL